MPQNLSTIRRLGGPSLARVAVLPVSAGCSALTAYLTIDYAGPATYGYIALISTLFLLLPFFDLGMGAPVLNAASDLGRRSLEDPRRFDDLGVIKAAMTTLAMVCVGCTGVALVVASLGLWPRILGVDERSLDHASAATFIALFFFFCSLPLNLGQRLLLAAGKNTLLILIAAATPAITALLTLLVIQFEAPPLALAGCTTASLALVACVCLGVGLRVSRIGLRDIYGADVRPASARTLIRTAGPFFVISLAIPAAMQSGRLVLSHVSSPAQLSEYALAAQLYAPALSVITAGAGTLWPLFRHAGSERDRLWRHALAFMSGMGLLISVSYALLARPVTQLVSDGQVELGWGLVWAFSGLLLVMSLQQPPGLLLTDAAGLRFQAMCCVIMLTGVLAGSIVLSGITGASGPALAACVGVGVCQTLPAYCRARRVLRDSRIMTARSSGAQ